MEESLRVKVVTTIAAKSLKKKDVAAAIGLSATRFSNKLHGTSKFTIEEMAALSRALGFSIDELKEARHDH